MQSCSKVILKAPSTVSYFSESLPHLSEHKFSIRHLAEAGARYIQHVWDRRSDQTVILVAQVLSLSAAKLWRFACLHSVARVYPVDVLNLSNVVRHFIWTPRPACVRGVWAALWHLHSSISCSARLSCCSFWQAVLFFKKRERNLNRFYIWINSLCLSKLIWVLKALRRTLLSRWAPNTNLLVNNTTHQPIDRSYQYVGGWI